jgi:hypothetical protein
VSGAGRYVGQVSKKVAAPRLGLPAGVTEWWTAIDEAVPSGLPGRRLEDDLSFKAIEGPAKYEVAARHQSFGEGSRMVEVSDR